MPNNKALSKNFWSYFWTQFLGAGNDNLFKQFLVTFLTYSLISAYGVDNKALIPLIGLVFIAPFFIFSALGSELADKYDSALLIRRIKLAEILIMIGASYFFIFTSAEWLIGILFCMGAQSAFFSPIKYSIIPKLAEENDMIKANGYVEMGTFLAILIGSIVGTQMMILDGQSLTMLSKILISAALVTISIFGYFASTRIESIGANNPTLKISKNPFKILIIENIKLVAYTKHQPKVFHYTVANSWFWFISSAFIAVLPLFVMDNLNAKKEVVSLLSAIFSVGIACGSLMCDKLRLKDNKAAIGLIPVGAIGLTVFLSLFAAFGILVPTPDVAQSMSDFLAKPTNWLIIATSFGIAFSGGLYVVPLFTGMQKCSDKQILGRVIGGFNVMSAFFMGAASFICTILKDAGLSIPSILLIFVAGHMLFHVWLLYFAEREFIARLISWCRVQFGLCQYPSQS